MRTIKFRGYNAKNKKWLYGFYLQNRGAHFVCPDEFARHKTWEDYEVAPETVSQFTGLCDKHGKEIYEGDIVLVYDNKFNTEIYKGAVKMRKCCWVVEHWSELFEDFLYPKLAFDDFANKKTAVLGNIYDTTRNVKKNETIQNTIRREQQR